MDEVAAQISTQLPCTSLRDHWCAPLLWIPLSLCLQSVSERPKSETKRSISDRNGVDGLNTSTNVDASPLSPSPSSFPRMSGFERRVLKAVQKYPFVSMRALRGVFPAVADYYTEDAVFEMSPRVASDVSAMIRSAWAEMELHKQHLAVVVVLNCYDDYPCHAVVALKRFFNQYFRESTCRCLVLDPTDDVRAAMTKHMFLTVRTNESVEDVARSLLKDIALSVLQYLNTQIVHLNSSVDGEKLMLDDALLAHEGGGGENNKDDLKDYRVAKRKGDLFLQVGALGHAQKAYCESLVASNSMWMSSTLESLTALRYLQRASLMALIVSAEKAFSSLENDETAWSEETCATFNEVEKVIESMRDHQRKATSLIKQGTSLSHLIKKLFREVEEPLTQNVEHVRKHLASIRRAFVSESNDGTTVSVENACRNAHGGFKRIVHLSFLELHLYLQEALQQLRFLALSQVSLHEREVEIHLKRAELYAEAREKRNFFETLISLKAAAKNVSEAMWLRILKRIPSLSSLCGCERKAVCYVVEAAVQERESNSSYAAVSLLLRACRMAGVVLPNVSTLSEKNNQIAFQRQEVGGDCVASNVEGFAASRACGPQVVPLLMELLRAATEADVDKSMQNVVGSILLFKYYLFLHRETQHSLMEVMERNGDQVDTPWMTPPPLLQRMETLALPPHLAPKTIPLSGAHFTFIDAGRLKMTLLTLNGKALPQGQVIWCVGDIGEVELTLTNPLQLDLHIASIVLSCRSVAALDSLDHDGDTVGHTIGPLAPSSYVVTDIILPSASTYLLRLPVQPNMQGYLVVDGVEIRLGRRILCSTFFIPSPKQTIVPVLPQLPVVSCTLAVNEVEIFGGQTLHFPLYLTNSGVVMIERLWLTAHDQSCQLDVCNGCKERVNSAFLYVVLENIFQNAEGSLSLAPGDTLLTRVTMVAPAVNDDVIFQHIVFRATVELPYDPPLSPENVPNAIPVFAVVPRRVHETSLPVFHSPSLTLVSLALSRDRRYVEIKVKNKNKLHTIELLCSHIFFANIADALVAAGTEYFIPPIEITKIPPDLQHISLPWIVREVPECGGTLSLDFSIIASEALYTEPLETALVTVTVEEHRLCGSPSTMLQWRSDQSLTNELPIILPVMKPVSLRLSINAPWARAIPIHMRLGIEHHMDAVVLSGAVDAICIVGGRDDNAQCNPDASVQHEDSVEFIEFFAFKTGEHVLGITLSDSDGREMTHAVKLQVKHTS